MKVMKKKLNRKRTGFFVIFPFVLLTNTISLITGRKKAVRSVGPLLTALAKASLKLFYIPKISDASEFDKFKKKLKSNFKIWESLFDITITYEDDDMLKIKVTNCPFCESLKDVGCSDLAPYVCQGDWEVASDNQGHWVFERENQIGTGSNYCDHTYKRKKGAY
jgi:predicted hydrocarbon binding protein